MMSTSMPVKEKCLLRGRASKVMERVPKPKWKPPCEDHWKPGSCSQGHNCPRYHPRRQPGRCAICGSTKHVTSQCPRPVKPKAKNAEWDESTWYCEEEECHDAQWESEEYEASKGKKGKGKGSKPKGKSKGKSTPKSIAPRPTQSSSTKSDRSQPKSKPEARSCMTNDFLFAMISTKSKPTWRHSTHSTWSEMYQRQHGELVIRPYGYIRCLGEGSNSHINLPQIWPLTV